MRAGTLLPTAALLVASARSSLVVELTTCDVVGWTVVSVMSALALPSACDNPQPVSGECARLKGAFPQCGRPTGADAYECSTAVFLSCGMARSNATGAAGRSIRTGAPRDIGDTSKCNMPAWRTPSNIGRGIADPRFRAAWGYS